MAIATPGALRRGRSPSRHHLRVVEHRRGEPRPKACPGVLGNTLLEIYQASRGASLAD